MKITTHEAKSCPSCHTAFKTDQWKALKCASEGYLQCPCCGYFGATNFWIDADIKTIDTDESDARLKEPSMTVRWDDRAKLWRDVKNNQRTFVPVDEMTHQWLNEFHRTFELKSEASNEPAKPTLPTTVTLLRCPKCRGRNPMRQPMWDHHWCGKCGHVGAVNKWETERVLEEFYLAEQLTDRKAKVDYPRPELGQLFRLKAGANKKRFAMVDPDHLGGVKLADSDGEPLYITLQQLAEDFIPL